MQVLIMDLSMFRRAGLIYSDTICNYRNRKCWIVDHVSNDMSKERVNPYLKYVPLKIWIRRNQNNYSDVLYCLSDV